jgi:hypothetical protein
MRPQGKGTHHCQWLLDALQRGSGLASHTGLLGYRALGRTISKLKSERIATELKMSFGKRTPVGHAGPERRSAPRRELVLPAEILLPGRPTRDCQILDISRTGARIGINSVFGIPVSFELRMPGQTLRATVVRKTPGRLYVKFG